jgi:hypothetical protein
LFRLAVDFDFDGGVAVLAFDDFVRHAFDFFLHLVKLAPHEALDGINRVARIGDGLALGGIADRSPDFVNATTDGVVRLPSEFSSTSGSPLSMTAMQEFVVPKSMPNTFAIKNLLLNCF